MSYLLERKVEISGIVSLQVYRYETEFTSRSKKYSLKDADDSARKLIVNALPSTPLSSTVCAQC